jgi:hypothetical protein
MHRANPLRLQALDLAIERCPLHGLAAKGTLPIDCLPKHIIGARGVFCKAAGERFYQVLVFGYWLVEIGPWILDFVSWIASFI